MTSKLKLAIPLMLLALGGAVNAASPAPAAGDKETATRDDDRSKDAAKKQADELKLRSDLDAARARLDKAAAEVAELSTRLGDRERRRFVFVGDERPHAVIGVQVDGGKDGARVLNVSPGGAAEEAGIRTGDVIVSVDGKSVLGTENPGKVVVEQMRAVKPDQKVVVRVVRSGKKQDFVVVARPNNSPDFRFRTDDMDELVRMGPMTGEMGPIVTHFRTFFPNQFGGMELAKLTPKLGAYFGTNDGVLVVQAPENAAFKLEDGDVIQAIDGRKPDDGAHALRILRSYKAGEKLNLTVLRQHKPMTLAIAMPEHPEPDDMMFGEPPMPPAPGAPPAPPAPGAREFGTSGGGSGTDD